MSKLYIGTSGFSYDDWVGDFYPMDIASNKRLNYYAEYFDTVEINNSFYNLPTKKTFQNWADAVPDGFVFSVKANRYITHMKNLMVDEEPINRLLKRAEPLGRKLGPILFQLPPQWNLNLERLEKFVNLLPTDYRFVFEFRNQTWYTEEVYELLKTNNLAFCIHDHQDAPSPEIVTADFVYFRFHGPDGYYQSKYNDQQLENWKLKIRKFLRQEVEVYCYFNNDFQGFAIDNAQKLKNLLLSDYED
jgi:uncharacterized protein YecE (DUF72 family)